VILWHFVHVDLGGAGCLAWNCLVWHVRQLLTLLLTERAWSFCLWQPLQTYLLVTRVECCAARPDVPLWQAAHLVFATFLPSCLMVWHEPHCL
jgi:hypothetical protein